MTEQREPSSRLWVSSRWQLLLLVAIPSLPFLIWGAFAWFSESSTARGWLCVGAILAAAWWLPLIIHYFTLLKCAHVWIEGDELILRRWGRTARVAIDQDLRLRTVGVLGRSLGVDATGSLNALTALASVVEGLFGPLTRECFELHWHGEGRSGARVLFYHRARFKNDGEPFQPGMRALRAKLAVLRTVRKAAIAAVDASKQAELEQAQEDERTLNAELAERAKVSRNPIKRMRKLRSKNRKS